MNGPNTDAAREQVQLGNQVIELDPASAATVRQAFQDLASSYGSAIDEQRRQLLSQLGTPQWRPPNAPVTSEPLPVTVPDTDLLFSNKDAWMDGLARNLDARLQQQNLQHTALVQGAVAAVDQELARRELRVQAQTVHDETMEEMLERRHLGDHRRIVQAIYNEQYQNLQNLPLSMAIDQIGQLSQEYINSIKGRQPTAEVEATTSHPTPPTMLRSARRAGATGAAPEPGHKSISDLILHRQAVLLGRTAA